LRRTGAKARQESAVSKLGLVFQDANLFPWYDFNELKKDSVAKAYLDFNVGSWVVDGEDKPLKTDREKWKATYDAAVKVKQRRAAWTSPRAS
jgi:hypothetical protein